MIGFFAAAENFFFKYFNFSGRATRAEFWWVMPLIWAMIAALFYLDASDVWYGLRAREVPSLNPLSYTWIIFFLITLIPRFSLTARRLHDSGRSAKWVTLPYTALFLSIMTGLGLLTAGATSGTNSVLETTLITAVVGIALAGKAGATATDAWEFAFAAANTLDWESSKDLVAYLMSDFQKPDIGTGMVNMQDALVNEPSIAVPAILVMSILIFGPGIAFTLYVAFMLMPSTEDENRFGQPQMHARGPKKSDSPHNPLAGYAALFEKTEEEKAQMLVDRKAEIESLYRQRVLRQAPE